MQIFMVPANNAIFAAAQAATDPLETDISVVKAAYTNLDNLIKSL